jgi:hypothetical protein
MRLWTGSWSPPKVKAATPATQTEKTEEPVQSGDDEPKLA